MAVALIALAGTIFAGVCTLWAVFPSLSSTGQRWANIIICLILVGLAISVIFGGRGFMYGPRRTDWRDRFNLQASFGAAAIVLILILAGVMYFTNEPSQNEKFAKKQIELETHVKDLTEKIDKMQTNLAVELNGISSKFSVLSNDASDLKNKVDAAQKKLDGLNRLSTDHSNELRQIEDDMKSLSGRVDQLEKGASQTK